MYYYFFFFDNNPYVLLVKGVWLGELGAYIPMVEDLEINVKSHQFWKCESVPVSLIDKVFDN